MLFRSRGPLLAGAGNHSPSGSELQAADSSSDRGPWRQAAGWTAHAIAGHESAMEPGAVSPAASTGSTPMGASGEPRLVPGQELDRDSAITAIRGAHPGAALLFSNGYTCRAAQALADRPSDFFNVGYMGGTLAIGWAQIGRAHV